jgi:hypothetical protein
MKKKNGLWIFLGGILVIALVLAFSAVQTQRAQAVFLEKYNLSNLDVKGIVKELDSRIDEPKELSSSINGKFLTLQDGETKVELEVPKDSFYLSFAPYENTTHLCGFHSLSGCRSELVNVVVHVTITDEKGVVILDDNLETMGNGFIGVWLPKDLNLNIAVTFDGKSASAPISTFADSETCLTTPLKLN